MRDIFFLVLFGSIGAIGAEQLWAAFKCRITTFGWADEVRERENPVKFWIGVATNCLAVAASFFAVLYYLSGRLDLG